MKEPKTERFDPNQEPEHITPDEIDMDDMPAIKPARAKPGAKQEPDEDSSVPSAEKPPPKPQESSQESGGESKQQSKRASERDSTLDSMQESEQASLHASTIASKHDSMIESIRRVVKETGSEVAYARLTPAEKRQLQDAVYAYKRRDIETSETEVIRIALNALLEDHQERGKDSTLARVIEALNT